MSLLQPSNGSGKTVFTLNGNTRSLRCCFYTGKLAQGKSVLTKAFSEKISAEAENSISGRVVVLSYLCNARKRAKESILNILKACIFQFVRAHKTELSRVPEDRDSLKWQWHPSEAKGIELSLDTLWGTFFTVLEFPHKPHFHCIIDIIGKCERNADKEKFITLKPRLNSSSAAVRTGRRKPTSLKAL